MFQLSVTLKKFRVNKVIIVSNAVVNTYSSDTNVELVQIWRNLFSELFSNFAWANLIWISTAVIK